MSNAGITCIRAPRLISERRVERDSERSNLQSFINAVSLCARILLLYTELIFGAQIHVHKLLERANDSRNKGGRSNR